ncbi:MAG: hypothetical protein QM784_10655 [Polyangiaceae bacterium]
MRRRKRHFTWISLESRVAMIERRCSERSSGERNSYGGQTRAKNAVDLEVRVTGADASFEALVVIEDPDAKAIARSIAGSTCMEVVEGAALIVAIVLPAVSPKEHAQPETTARPLEKDADASRSAPQRQHWQLGGGAAVLLLTGVAPAVLPGVEAFADVSTYANGWSPSFRAGFAYLARSKFEADAEGGRAAFRLMSGVVSACPAAWLPNRAIVLRACATSTFGSLRGSGSGAAETSTESHPWMSLGGGLRLEFRALEAMSVELEGVTEAALFRARFWFSGETFYETARANERLGLNLVARIP